MTPRARPRRVVVTGTGAVTSFGLGGFTRACEGLARGERTIALAGSAMPGLESYALGLVRDLSAFRTEFPELSPPLPLRETQVVLLAAREAMRDAALSMSDPHEDIGVFLDRTWGPSHNVKRMIEPMLAGGPQKISPLVFSQSVANAPAGAIARLLGVRGPNLTTMGGGALYLAVQALRRGEVPTLLAGGFDDVQSDYVLAEERLGRIHPRAEPGAYASYDPESPGATLGEGAVILVLEEASHASARGASGRASITGVAVLCDPDAPYGASLIAECAALALEDAGVRADEIVASVGCADGNVAHGRAELDALRTIGVRAEPLGLKGLIGDTLGMAASIAVAWAAASVRGPTLVLEATRDGHAFACVVDEVAP